MRVSKRLLAIRPDGAVRIEGIFNANIAVSYDLRRFPLDRQVIPIQIESFTWNADQMTLHPRTEKQLRAFGLWDKVAGCQGIHLVRPLSYHEMLRMNAGAQLMLTDSGGLQEECCVIGTPCITLRENTERPVTLREHHGVSELAGNDPERIRRCFHEMKNLGKLAARPPLWDGHTAERIVETFAEEMRKT